MTRESREQRVPVVDRELQIVGGETAGARDLYHGLLRVPWWAAMVVIASGYLVVSMTFAVLYLLAGGIANARPGSFADAFFFSVETLSTIGYGAMYPATPTANLLAVAESIVGLLAVAMVAAVIYARLSLARAQLLFSRAAAVGPMDGVPTVMIRIGNQRTRNQVVDARFWLTLSRREHTAEGVVMYRSIELALVRDRAPSLSRCFVVQHRITPDSPLFGETPETLARAEAEITLALSGVDETSLQPIHARKLWFDRDVAWGARLADVLSETEEGHVLLDLRRFHDLEPTEPSPAFPYPRPASRVAGRRAEPRKRARSGGRAVVRELLPPPA